MLTHWNASSDFAPLFNRVFSEPFFKDLAVAPRFSEAREASPLADVIQTEKEVKLVLDMPGLNPQDIHVKWEDDTLTVSAERKFEKTEGTEHVRIERHFGKYARSFVLPKTLDGSRCEAQYLNGVLTLTLPKKEEARPRSIEIKVGA